MISNNDGETEYKIVYREVSEEEEFTLGKYEEIIDVKKTHPNEYETRYGVSILKRV